MSLILILIVITLNNRSRNYQLVNYHVYSPTMEYWNWTQLTLLYDHPFKIWKTNGIPISRKLTSPWSNSIPNKEANISMGHIKLQPVLS